MSSYGLDGKNFGSTTTHSLGPLIWIYPDILSEATFGPGAVSLYFDVMEGQLFLLSSWPHCGVRIR